MSKVSISEAVGMTGVSESTIRQDIKRGKLSSEKDAKCLHPIPPQVVAVVQYHSYLLCEISLHVVPLTCVP